LILEQRNIAGKDIMDIIFRDTNLSSEELGKTFRSLLAILDEDYAAFEKNQENLVTRIEKKFVL
jgi:hypothetical protein